MKCDRCDSPATVHEVTIRNGQRVERHLCESCARGGGGAGGGGGGGEPGDDRGDSRPAGQPVLGALGVTGPAGRAAASACPRCELTYMQFKHDGMLGCPGCYDAFEAALGPMLERAHEGGTHHTGRVPLGGKAPGVHDCGGRRADALRRAAALREALAEAVRGEEYERAVRLRDELRRVEAELVEPADGRGSA